MNLLKLKSLVLLVLSLITMASFAQRVGGGGAPKPLVSFGYENILAIAKNQEVQKILAKSFGDEKFDIKKLELTSVDKNGFHYRLETASVQTQECVLDITVWNTHQTLTADVLVTNVTVVSGCESKKFGQVKPLQDLITINKSNKVNNLLQFSFRIDSIALKNESRDGKVYTIKANPPVAGNTCEIEAIVKDQDVVSAKNVSAEGGACKIIEKPKPVSVLEKYKDVFDKSAPALTIEEDASYDKYVNEVSKLSPELRAEIREYMRTSEPAYYNVLTKNKDVIAKFFKSYKPVKIGHALYILYKIMGFPLDTGGIYMPAIIGLKFVPFFILD